MSKILIKKLIPKTKPLFPQQHGHPSLKALSIQPPNALSIQPPNALSIQPPNALSLQPPNALLLLPLNNNELAILKKISFQWQR